jgi:hypothetical protein
LPSGCTWHWVGCCVLASSTYSCMSGDDHTIPPCSRSPNH